MSSPIVPIRNVAVPELTRAPAEATRPGVFQDVLSGAIQRVESSRNEATLEVEKFLSGEEEDLHTAALATQRAELALDLFLQVRNKVVQAYQEIMRMQM